MTSQFINASFQLSRPFHAARRPAFLFCALIACCAHVAAHAHGLEERDVEFSCAVARVAGTLTLPERDPAGASSPEEDKIPCVVIVGGTLSHTRDGGFVRPGAPPRDALKRLASALADSGFASLRFDKVGYGKSAPNDKWRGTYQDEASVAAAAIEFARADEKVGKVAAIGESAGAYLLCIAAKKGVAADAYVFLGGHCDSGQAIYEYNFGRLVKYAESSPENLVWVKQHARFELALGRTYRAMFAAAARGEKSFEIVDGNLRRVVDLARRQEELEMPPNEMFQFIKSPALAMSGGADLNVPPDHAARIASKLRAAGNHSATCQRIPNVDHNFQLVPEDDELRIRERHSLESFRRDYDPTLYATLISWLGQTLHGAPPAGADARTAPHSGRAVVHAEFEPKSEHQPAKLYLAPGVQIVDDITDKTQMVGVSTLEGEIGPLIAGESGQAHFIDMPPGMYCEEHPHGSESIIYTVRGKWVLCSQGRRHVMKPGTLFHFAPNTPTGYEVPYDEHAIILIFKSKRSAQNEDAFVTYLKGLAERLEREHESGVPFWLADLPDDHPAVVFARRVNPGYSREARPAQDP